MSNKLQFVFAKSDTYTRSIGLIEEGKKWIEGNPIYLNLYTSPTGNCQLSIAGYMEQTLAVAVMNKESIPSLHQMLNSYCSNLVLVDIHVGCIPNLLKVFGEKCIHSRMDYKSTNGSQMSIILMNRPNRVPK